MRWFHNAAPARSNSAMFATLQQGATHVQAGRDVKRHEGCAPWGGFKNSTKPMHSPAYSPAHSSRCLTDALRDMPQCPVAAACRACKNLVAQLGYKTQCLAKDCQGQAMSPKAQERSTDNDACPATSTAAECLIEQHVAC